MSLGKEDCQEIHMEGAKVHLEFVSFVQVQLNHTSLLWKEDKKLCEYGEWFSK